MKYNISCLSLFILIASIFFLGSCNNVNAESSNAPQEKNNPNNYDPNAKVNYILNKLQQSNDNLKTFEADVKYLFIQNPELLDSRTLQTGSIYYQKKDKYSLLRINFEFRKQDDDKPQKYIEQYLFDGFNLEKVNYQMETVDIEQISKDKAIEAFEYISRYFPLIGFSDSRNLTKDFEISINDQQNSDPNDLIGLKLKVKKDSKYIDKYSTINFWIKSDIFLPVKIVTVSTEEDIYDFQLLNVKVNKKLKNSVFKLETPKHFSENIRQ